MRIGLVSYRCENNNIPFNLHQIESALKETKGKTDLLCFGEAFLQGFDSLIWEYETDQKTAVAADGEIIQQLCRWTEEYGTALLTGYIEKADDKIYSSCIVIAEGNILFNYRRITKGWKEYRRTDSHYCEGSEVSSFRLHGTNIRIALCGDLWDKPDRFKTDDLLIWPVYVNYSVSEWENGILTEYALQACKAASRTLMVNPLDTDPVNHGGAFFFQSGKIKDSIPFDREGILIAEI